jgi:hypothetical protein
MLEEYLFQNVEATGLCEQFKFNKCYMTCLILVCLWKLTVTWLKCTLRLLLTANTRLHSQFNFFSLFEILFEITVF